jgi:hypothetical protein
MANEHFSFKGREVYSVPDSNGFGAPDLRDALTGRVIDFYTGLPILSPERAPTREELVRAIDEIYM